MSQNINLIPQEERKEQVKGEILRISSVITIGVLVVTSIIASYFFYNTRNLKNQIDELDSQIEDARATITDHADIEVIARNLDVRKNSLSSLITTRNDYSLVMEEVQRRLPQAVEIEEFNLAGSNSLTISGVADNYLSIASYITNFTDKNYVNSPDNLKALFTNVTLNSVSLNEAASQVEFFITVEYDANLLKRKL